MKRFMFAAVFVLGATSAQAELYDGTQELGVGDYGSPRPAGVWSQCVVDGPTIAFFWLNTHTLGSNCFLAESGTMTVVTGPHVGIYTLDPGGPMSFLSPDGSFIGDNKINGPLPYGLIFSGPDGDANLFISRRTGELTLLFDSKVQSEPTPEPSSLPTPEPSSIAIVGIAVSFILAGCVLRRRHTA